MSNNMDEVLKREEERIKRHFVPVQERPVAKLKPKVSTIAPTNPAKQIPRPKVQTTTFSVHVVVCAACNKPAYPQESVSCVSNGGNLVYHAGCFRCVECKKTLTLTTFRNVNGSLYCQRHATEAMSREAESRQQTLSVTPLSNSLAGLGNCFVCQLPIQNRFFNVSQDKNCHEACFRCNKCKALLDSFFEEGSNLLCPSCFQISSSSSTTTTTTTASSPNSNVCGSCGKKVNENEKSIFALDKLWHSSCFVCKHCKNPISSKCIENNGNVYCSETCLDSGNPTAASAANIPMCAKCKKPVPEGCDYLIVGESQYHSECFVCAKCKASLAGVDFYNVGNDVLCGNCI